MIDWAKISGIIPAMLTINGKLLRLLPQVYSGSFIKDPVVELLRARRVEIDGDGLFLMGDGEELGEVPAVAECVPGVLSVVVGD